jgi:hypothetical protein
MPIIITPLRLTSYGVTSYNKCAVLRNDFAVYIWFSIRQNGYTLYIRDIEKYSNSEDIGGTEIMSINATGEMKGLDAYYKNNTYYVVTSVNNIIYSITIQSDNSFNYIVNNIIELCNGHNPMIFKRVLTEDYYIIFIESNIVKYIQTNDFMNFTQPSNVLFVNNPRQVVHPYKYVDLYAWTQIQQLYA